MAKKLIPGDLVRMSDLAGDCMTLSTRPSPTLAAATKQNVSGQLNTNSIAIVLAVDGIAATSVYVLGSTGGGWIASAFLIKALIQTMTT